MASRVAPAALRTGGYLTRRRGFKSHMLCAVTPQDKMSPWYLP
jgi:hypothetical protein